MSIKFISVNKLPKVPIPQSHGVKHYKNVAYYSVPNDGINCAFAGVAIWAGAFHTKPMELAAKVRQRVTKFIEESYPDQTALLGQLNANGPVDKVIFRYIAELFGIRMHVLSFDVKHPARVGKQDVLEIYNADLREEETLFVFVDEKEEHVYYGVYRRHSDAHRIGTKLFVEDIKKLNSTWIVEFMFDAKQCRAPNCGIMTPEYAEIMTEYEGCARRQAIELYNIHQSIFKERINAGYYQMDEDERYPRRMVTVEGAEPQGDADICKTWEDMDGLPLQ